LIPEKDESKAYHCDSFDAEYKAEEPDYFITSGHINRWTYSPEECEKIIETVFYDD